MKTQSSWAERFYTHFIYRDFCYLFAGGLFISIVEYVLLGDIFLPNKLSLELLGFLIGSYLIGLAIESLSGQIGLTYNGYLNPPQYSSYLLFMQDTIMNFDEKVLNEHERTFFMGLIGKTVGASSFFGALLMFVSTFIHFIFKSQAPTFEYLMISFSLLIYGLYMIFDSRHLFKQYERENKELGEGILSNQNKNTVQISNEKKN